MIVSFSGYSGSGKSTLIKRIIDQNIFSSSVKIKREDDFFLINLFQKLFGNSSSIDYNLARQGNLPNPKKNKLFKLIDILYPLGILVEYILFYIWYEVIFPKSIIIMDRYAYDYYVTSFHNLRNPHNFITSLLFNFPRPSIAFYASTDPNRALKCRNGGLNKLNCNKEFVSQVISTYSTIVKKHKLVVLESDLNEEQTFKKARSYLSLRDKFHNISSISLSGTDGTGKSTVAQYIRESLELVNIHCRVIHFFHDTLLNKLIRLIPGLGDSLPQRIGKAISKQGNILWAVANYLDALLQVFLTRLLYSNCLVIYDRYFYDFLATFNFYQIPFATLFGKIIPKTDMAVLFIGSPRLSVIRKPENTLKNYIKLQSLYSQVADIYKLEIINVSNITPRQIVKRIQDI